MTQGRRLLLDAAYLFAGCAITLGFWFGPDIQQWFESRNRIEPAAALPGPARFEPVAPATPPPRSSPETSSPVRPDREAQALQRMAQTCAFWSARAEDRSGRVFRDRACDAMRDYARDTQQPIPKISIERAPTTDSRTSRRANPVGVFIRECTSHVRGSIAYRNCRADEKQRLKQRCQYHRQREEWREAGPWCSAAENYRVVQ